MLKFKTVHSTFAYLSSNLLNEVGLSLFRYFEVGLRVCDIVVKKFTFAISSPDEFLFLLAMIYRWLCQQLNASVHCKSSVSMYSAVSIRLWVIGLILIPYWWLFSDGRLLIVPDHWFVLDAAMPDMGRTVTTSATITWSSAVLCKSTTCLWY